ncbi:MAG: RtcB family protein [Actinobacteria bacterium]|nr:MAG: RtcB family protein [Actinomycetota bacterium]
MNAVELVGASRRERTTRDIRIFESVDSPADPHALAVLERGVADADLAAPAVVLPDFHLKPDKEMPSSIAVATRDTIRTTMTCCSLNCGMALVALDIERPHVDAVTDFYRRVRERLPFPPTYRRDLSVEEVVRCAADGARFAADKFGVDGAALAGFEEGGVLDLERYGGVERARRELPWLVKHLSRIRFGTIGKSNHFIELQQVEDVLDPEAARLLGVEVGQIMLQYHGGGGTLPGQLGVLFGARKRYTKPLRMEMAFQKPLYHLARARSVRQLRTRAGLYFTGGAKPVELEGIEGERLMLANTMAMNYGFAFRTGTFSILTSLLDEAFGAGGSRLVVDSPHNSIYEEHINGSTAVVHRHNAARAYPASRMAHHPVFGRIGQPLLLPGTSRTSSYLCVAREGSANSLYSAPHGAGATIKHFEAAGISQRDIHRRVTLRYSYSGSAPVEVEQLDDRGIDDTLDTLRAADVLQPVARLRPFAVLN